MTAPNTFWKLLETYDVHIPMIQRDYAQGRNDDRTIEIRSSLLENIKGALVDNKNLDFDFIYGSIEKNVLSPLDGQQRLTVLFLLHWYFAVKEQKNISETLVKFSYSTRVSARDFCEQLTRQPISYTEFNGTTVASIIKNKKWFQFRWKMDPTVEGMLVVLDAIHDIYESIDQPVLDKLMSDDCPITFSFLELKRFGLGDELYIKMNSRGKPLSTFENFKAQFEQLLEKNGFVDESKHFSLKVETEWTDLLWAYRGKDYTIDDAFMKLFTFISSALYLKAHLSVRSSGILTKDFSKVSDLAAVYNNKENIEFLFAVLSLWKDQQEIHQEFETIFNELPLFNTDIQLFDKCINNTLQLDERILLYTIIVKKLAKQEGDLVDTLRVIRNLLNRIRQGNNGVFNSNLRVENIGPILNAIDEIVMLNKPIYEGLLEMDSLSGIAERSLLQEKEKAALIKKNPQLKTDLHKLEDIPRLKGAVHLWIDAFLNYPNQLPYTLMEIEKISPALLSRAMLSIGNYQVKIGSSNLGARYLFGGNSANLEFLWTYNKDSLKPFFTKFITAIMNSRGQSMEEKVSSLIETKKWTMFDWQYYFIKYDSMIKDYYQVFTFSDNDNAKLSGIERLSGINLQSVHINPIYEAIVMLVDDDSICRMEDCQKRLTERSEIKMANNIVFRLNGTQWTYAVDTQMKDDLDRYAQTISNYDIVEQGYALVMKAHELVSAAAVPVTTG
ncbi:DUF262 domain-containing protein [Peribacillus glennii]|uniref:DUF262 domain-containing protein n=1 Tax=Peribacillus glennii TaxID=2303991 RepID=A0A372L996_9BACI|nr:DUF262 domain-containing protein [Peribacillus glennii]RFU61109.1 DUF262 domain-containing protein [Peribacillus glennii]